MGDFYCFIFQFTDSLLCLLYLLLSQSIKASYFCSSCQEGYPPDWSAWPAGCCRCGHNLEPLEVDLCSQNRSQEQRGMVRPQEYRIGVRPCSLQAKVWPGHIHLWSQVDIQTELKKYKHEEGSGCCSGSSLPMVAKISDTLWCPRRPPLPSPSSPIWATFQNGDRLPGPALHAVRLSGDKYCISSQ